RASFCLPVYQNRRKLSGRIHIQTISGLIKQCRSVQIFPKGILVSSFSSHGIVLTFLQGFCKKGDECRKSHTLPQQTSSISSPLDETISDLLPNSTPQNERLIPVNKNGERIDTSLPRPSATSWSMYQRRSRLSKPCNKYHVTGDCYAEDC